MKTKTSTLVPTNGATVAVATEEQPKTFYFYGNKTVEYKGNKITRRVAFAGVQTGPHAIRLGKAMCSEKDKFLKKKARAIATGRAIKAPEEILYLNDDTTPIKQFIARVSSLLDPVERNQVVVTAE